MQPILTSFHQKITRPQFTKVQIIQSQMVLETLSKNAKACHDVIETQPGAEYAEGSWWQAFNSVTYMTDHLQGREGDSRLQSAWYGRNRKVKLNALDKALEYAEAA